MIIYLFGFLFFAFAMLCIVLFYNDIDEEEQEQAGQYPDESGPHYIPHEYHQHNNRY